MSDSQEKLQQGYDQLQKKNRRRLIGGGAAALVASALFAIVASSGEENHETPQLSSEANALAERPAPPKNVETEILPVQNEAPASIATLAEPEKPAPAAQTTPPAATKTEITAQQAQLAAQNAEAQLAEQRREIADKARQNQEQAERHRLAEKNQTAQTIATAPSETKNKNRTEHTNTPVKKTEAPAKPKQPLALVQAGAFRDKAAAQRLKQRINSLNYSVNIEEIQTDKGIVYRVKTGSFPNKAEAELALKKLQSHGIGGRVLEYKK